MKCEDVVDGQIIKISVGLFHPKCFNCVVRLIVKRNATLIYFLLKVCHKNLVGIPFTVDGANQTYCPEDFRKYF